MKHKAHQYNSVNELNLECNQITPIYQNNVVGFYFYSPHIFS